MDNKKPLTGQAGTTRVLTGVKPTHDLHIGNYATAIKPCIQFSKNPKYEVILLCADWHGLTDRARLLEPGKQTPPMVAAFLAFGFNVDGNALIVQSHFRQILEIAWYLSSVTAVGLLERAHAYKDALASGKKPSAALLYYPVLMAADILTFDAELVPVGADQAQHLEYASDMTKSFNSEVAKPVFFEPKPLIETKTLVPGIDGDRKMSKSYDNFIPLFGDPKDVEKKIKSIKTDSLGLNDPKDPEQCVIFQILKSFGSDAAIADMQEKLKSGKNYGYGHAKADLLQEHKNVFESKRPLYEHFLQNPKEVAQKLEPGYARAEKIANAVVKRACESLGLLAR